MTSDRPLLHAGEAPTTAKVETIASWAGLPCDAARARRLEPLLAAQRERMQRLYDEPVEGCEFDFLKPREDG